MSHYSTVLHLLPLHSCGLNRGRWVSMTQTNGWLTRSSTLSNSTGRCINSDCGPVIVMYGLAANLQRGSVMCSNWLITYTESIRRNLDDDWTSRIEIRHLLWEFDCFWMSFGFRANINGFPGILITHLCRRSFFVHWIRRESAHCALIGCGTYQSQMEAYACWVGFLIGFLLLIHPCAGQRVCSKKGWWCNGNHDLVLANATRRVQGRVTATSYWLLANSVI